MLPIFYHLLLLYVERSPVRILMLMNPEFFLNTFLKCEPLFKVFIEFVTILLLFHVLVFWPQSTWDLPFPTRFEPTVLALEGRVFTTGLPGKS